MSKLKRKKIAEGVKLQLPEGIFSVGPGTVPSSNASASKTSIEEITSLSRRASKKGIFEEKESEEYGSFQNPAR